MVSIYYYSAVWCGPCKFFKPIFEDVVKDFPDVEFHRIDVDHIEDGPSIQRAMKHQVLSIPTLIKEIDGLVVNRFIGAMNEPELRTFIGG